MSTFGHGPATIKLGDLEVCRMGYGAMRLPGPMVWGEPPDRDGAIAVLRRAVDLGVGLIDTAWYYGPLVSNRLIREALHPYPKHLVIATKLGGKRLPDKGWAAAARPDELRQGCEEDLRSLGVERSDVVHLRFMKTSGVPFRESLDALIALQAEGKVRHIALSNVSAVEIEDALSRTPIVSVQNMFNVGGGASALARNMHAVVDDPEGVLELCTTRGIAYMPYFPLGAGKVDAVHSALATIAEKRGVSSAQIALAWLLARSPMVLPIPGTRSIAHLEENWSARALALDEAELAALGVEAAAS